MEKNVAADFDPNAPGINNGCYFGLPFTPEEAQLVLLPGAVGGHGVVWRRDGFRTRCDPRCVDAGRPL